MAYERAKPTYVIAFKIISRSILLRVKNVLNQSCIGNQNTCFISKFSFPPENRAVLKMRKNVIRDGSQHGNVVRRTGFECLKTKATDTHLDDVTL